MLLANSWLQLCSMATNTNTIITSVSEQSLHSTYVLLFHLHIVWFLPVICFSSFYCFFNQRKQNEFIFNKLPPADRSTHHRIITFWSEKNKTKKLSGHRHQIEEKSEMFISVIKQLPGNLKGRSRHCCCDNIDGHTHTHAHTRGVVHCGWTVLLSWTTS